MSDHQPGNKESRRRSTQRDSRRVVSGRQIDDLCAHLIFPHHKDIITPRTVELAVRHISKLTDPSLGHITSRLARSFAWAYNNQLTSLYPTSQPGFGRAPKWNCVNTETVAELLLLLTEPTIHVPRTVTLHTLAGLVDAVKTIFTYSPRNFFANSDLLGAARQVPPLFVRCAYRALTSRDPQVSRHAAATLGSFHRGGDQSDYATQALLLGATWYWLHDCNRHPSISWVTTELFSSRREAFATLEFAANGLTPYLVNYPLEDANCIWECGYRFIQSQHFGVTLSATR